MNLTLRKIASLLVLVPVLWWSLPARAQEATSGETTVLKAAHQGAFLPPGTAVVVLDRPAATLRDDLYQPEFVAPGAFPSAASLLLRRDTLDGWRQTRTRYPKTQASGRVYFVYALTPDSTLYWSYSAPRDSLKFDVVDRGVMSVAPVADAARAAVLAAYFRPQPAEADGVVVYMRGDRPPSDSLSAALRPDSLLMAVLDTPAALPQVAAAPPAATPLAVRPERRRPERRAAGVVMAPALFYGFLALVLGLVGVLAYLAWIWRRDLQAVRRDRLGLWMQQVPRMMVPDRNVTDATEALHAAEQARAEAEQAREYLEQEYAVLKGRYNALRRELDLRRAGDGV